MAASDSTGKSIGVGDRVAFVHNHYKDLYFGKIKSISPKTVLISIGNTTTRKAFTQIVKVDTNKVYLDKPKTFEKLNSMIDNEHLKYLEHHVQSFAIADALRRAEKKSW